jgi:hypothetical protein
MKIIDVRIIKTSEGKFIPQYQWWYWWRAVEVDYDRAGDCWPREYTSQEGARRALDAFVNERRGKQEREHVVYQVRRTL